MTAEHRHAYRLPEFLTDDDSPTHRVRCPVHGFVRFSENERRIIDHWVFQRLRFIRQLAFTEYVYPGATHTRFEHSLGVMEFATRAFDSLAAKHGATMEAVFAKVPEMKDRPMARARQLLRLSALLHDTGHSCFSHAAEEAIQKAGAHEQLTLHILRDKDLLGSVVDSRFWSGSAELVAKLVEGGRDLPPQLKLLHDIVSGQMDADRTDYLLRDSLHCGVDYGRFDSARLVESLDLHQEIDSSLEIALDYGGLHAFEALILARYQMNTQVYHHRLRALYDHYLKKYLEVVGPVLFRSHEDILAQTDSSMIARIFRDAESGDGEARRWAGRIRNRDHDKLVFETGFNANAEDLRRASERHRHLEGAHPDRSFLYLVSDGKIHDLLTESDTSEQGLVRLMLKSQTGSTQPIAFGSQILNRIPHRFQCARVFVEWDDPDRIGLDALREETRRWGS